jgi:nucleotide-binding universal stress UspA family protein
MISTDELTDGRFNMKLDDLKPVRLLIAVDGSPGSIKALRKAMEMVKDSVSYELVLVHVLDLRAFPLLSSEADDARQEQDARTMLEKMLDIVKAEAEDGRTVLLRGHPVQALLDYADTFRPTMMMVGDHGMNAARNALVGSVSSGLTRKAKWPVLVVR